MKPEILNEKLTCAEDIVKAINRHQELANNYRNTINSHTKKDENKFSISLTKAFVYLPEINQHHNYRKIENLKLYYNFFNKNAQ